MTASHLLRRRLVAGWDEHPLGVGCRPIGGPATNLGHAAGWAPVDDDCAVDALLRAREEGATVFDTSDVYGLGHSQRLLGRMLAQVPRESVSITSTVGAFRGTGVNAYSSLNLHGQVEQSLENLGVESLNVLTLHHTDFGPRDQYLQEARETLEALRDLGRVKALGMRAPNRLTAGTATSGDRNQVSAARFAFLVQQFAPKVITTPFNPLSQPPEPEVADSEGDEDIFSFARRHGVATMITEPLGLGLLTGKYLPDTAFGPGDVRSRITAPVLAAVQRGLQPLRGRFGSSPHDLARVALQYCLRRCPDSIVLAGFTSSQQVAVNYQGFKTGLSDLDYEFVDAAYAALRAELVGVGQLRSREAASVTCIPGPGRPAHVPEER
ncbi:MULTISPECIES: aldo/keto reductase [Streptomyces]|uniref:aldo/keto reductase n=1 Tax=Streptomyces TaxID=1883 RepID=UPI0007C83B95|nr:MULTISPECIES: aldo/keto reductase [Streptomyces]MDX3275215.1 aldo/keto reductase [Streptomyces scabiei]MDX3847020.1 aldo/keto reductase [Streptomyces europaeiscabiei]